MFCLHRGDTQQRGAPLYNKPNEAFHSPKVRRKRGLLALGPCVDTSLSPLCPSCAAPARNGS